LIPALELCGIVPCVAILSSVDYIGGKDSPFSFIFKGLISLSWFKNSTDGMYLNSRGLYLSFRGLYLNSRGLYLNFRGMFLNLRGMFLNLPGDVFKLPVAALQIYLG